MKIELKCFIPSGLRHMLLIFFLFSASSLLFAQNMKQVSGTVYSAENNPLPGVTVLVKGTSRGTSTDEGGKFSIEVNTTDVLVFSYLGHQVKEISVRNK